MYPSSAAASLRTAVAGIGPGIKSSALLKCNYYFVEE
jgi:hypothetical protein